MRRIAAGLAGGASSALIYRSVRMILIDCDHRPAINPAENRISGATHNNPNARRIELPPSIVPHFQRPAILPADFTHWIAFGGILYRGDSIAPAPLHCLVRFTLILELQI